MVDATPGILTSLNTGSINGGAGERVLIDYKEALMDYRVADLPVMQFFADPMTTDTGGNIDITFAKPSMAMEQIDEGNTPQYQHTKLRSERVAVKEWGLAVGVTRRMIEDSRFNEVEMALNEARRAVDRHMTAHVVKVIFGAHAADTTFGTVAIDETTSESTVTTFSTNPQGGFFGTGATFDGRLDSYADQSLTTLQACNSYNRASGDTAGDIALSNIASAMTRMSKLGYKATHLFMSPAHYENLLKLADFASVFTANQAVTVVSGGNVMPTDPANNPFSDMLNTGGLVGQIYGLNVIVNPWVPATRMGVFDLSTKPMAYVERRGMTVEEANPGFGIVGSYMSMRYGLKITRPEAGQIIINGASG
tara:strand:+ start:108 stop:1202 length:1095 start_codon:yes stop_codon:yes gene_type:complete